MNATVAITTKLATPEKTRTYVFPEGKTVTFIDVVAVGAPPGRSHRLETADGKKHIVPQGWLAITLETPAWSF